MTDKEVFDQLLLRMPEHSVRNANRVARRQLLHDFEEYEATNGYSQGNYKPR